MTQEIDKDKITAAIDMLVDSNTDLSGILEKGGLIKELNKRLLEKALEAEMQEHLGYAKHANSKSTNARNGTNTKEIIRPRWSERVIPAMRLLYSSLHKGLIECSILI